MKCMDIRHCQNTDKGNLYMTCLMLREELHVHEMMRGNNVKHGNFKR